MLKSIIPYSKQYIDKNDIKNVAKVLRSKFLTTGPEVPIFEKLINKNCNSKYSIAVNSATSALHIACLALGLKKNDIVWTTPISFVASANCAKYCGAKVDFVDIDIDTFNLCPLKLEEKLKKTKKKYLPKIVIPVHLGGQSCDMNKIYSLSKKYKFKIIEDASHAIGGKYRNNKVGNCKYSDVCVFSFHPVKIVTTGEGGIATTNSYNLAKKMKIYREHGLVREVKFFKGKSHGPWHYQQQELGFNYRMSDIHAALGISQLSKIDKFIKKRNKISTIYKKELRDLPIEFQKNKNNGLSTYHLFIILVPEKLHLKLFQFLRNKKIFINLHYIPIFLHPFFKKNIKIKNFGSAINYYNRAISLPAYYSLKEIEQKKVILLIKNFFYETKI